jgi:hypothetical protein
LAKRSGQDKEGVSRCASLRVQALIRLGWPQSRFRLAHTGVPRWPAGSSAAPELRMKIERLIKVYQNRRRHLALMIGPTRFTFQGRLDRSGWRVTRNYLGPRPDFYGMSGFGCR